MDRITNYSPESFRDEFGGKFLSDSEVKLFDYAKERTPVKEGSTEKEKIGIEFYLEATTTNFKMGAFRLISTSIDTDCDLNHTFIMGSAISKPVFEYINEEKFKSKARVIIKAKGEENHIFKSYIHQTSSLLVKEIKPKIIQQEIFITNTYSKYVFFKYSVKQIKFLLNMETGSIEMKVVLCKEDFDEISYKWEKETIVKRKPTLNKIKKQKKTQKKETLVKRKQSLNKIKKQKKTKNAKKNKKK
jgi:hypothetical protein